LSRIGFFGGTFDPIHFGHINAAIGVKEALNLDEVIFCPTSLSPDKIDTPPMAGPEDRLAMVNLALNDIDGMRVDDGEVFKEGISYTVDSIRKFKGELFLLVGADIIDDLSNWKDGESLLELCKPVPVFKSGERGSMDINSTVIRERLSKKLYCGHLLPAKVLDYISQKELYC